MRTVGITVCGTQGVSCAWQMDINLLFHHKYIGSYNFALLCLLPIETISFHCLQCQPHKANKTSISHLIFLSAYSSNSLDAMKWQLPCYMWGLEYRYIDSIKKFNDTNCCLSNYFIQPGLLQLKSFSFFSNSWTDIQGGDIYELYSSNQRTIGGLIVAVQ